MLYRTISPGVRGCYIRRADRYVRQDRRIAVRPRSLGIPLGVLLLTACERPPAPDAEPAGPAAPVSYRVGEEQHVLVAIGRSGGIVGSAESRTAAPHARGPAFKLGGGAAMPAPTPPVAVPEPPARIGTADEVVAGQALWAAYACSGCHGAHALGVGSRALGGALPDLRYMPPSAHEEWDSVVLEGTRAVAGMPGYGAEGMSVGDSRALQAYVIDRAWAAYDESGSAAPAADQ